MRTAFEILCCILVAVLLSVVMVEWLAGCGESYVDASGMRHRYACVFLPYDGR